METRIITENMLSEFENYLWEEEKCESTITQYIRSVRRLMAYADGREIDKHLLREYKDKLIRDDSYKDVSANNFLVALNRFLGYMGWHELRIRTFRVQKNTMCAEEKYITKEEYRRLLKAAKGKGDIQLLMMLQTLCGLGLRVSELQFITVESVRRGAVEIRNKGKSRKVLFTPKLQKILQIYIAERGMEQGTIFTGKHGGALNRTTIWRRMKGLCEAAKVEGKKVFPHNLRHLFAVNYYNLKKDIAKLADLLGHSSIETTRIYIRTTWREHRKELEKMDLVYGMEGF